MKAMLRLRNCSITDDGACLWSWFSSVQAATHNEHGDRTRTAHDSGWDVSVAGVLVALLALAIFVLEKSNRGLRGLNGSEGTCVSSAVSAVSAVQQFFEFL